MDPNVRPKQGTYEENKIAEVHFVRAVTGYRRTDYTGNKDATE
jgi:hypothetical protein